jgi:predicted RNA polymerase sigma factor
MPALPPDTSALPELPTLLRPLIPQVLGSLVRRYGDFAAAEDAVQDALVAAVEQWPRDGLPANPRGWLIQVAIRRVTDRIRADTARRRRESVAASDLSVASTVLDAGDRTDDTLILLWTCCHPALARSAAIALTLRAVGGLTTAEIARAFLVPEATMAQRISRAKQRIAASGIPFQAPDAGDRPERLDVVLHVLYLIFNEGYASTSGPSLQRVDLAREAIRLTRALDAAAPGDPEVEGLLALMLLTDARRAARTGPQGELIPLEEQDRSAWDHAAIAEGAALVTRALGRGRAGPYQIQAAIAALHDEAPSVGDTDWAQILALYDRLHALTGNPMVALNRAVAVAMVHGAARGLDAVRVLEDDPRIAGHYRLDAVRGHLHEMLGDTAAAVVHYRASAGRTTSAAERDYLALKAARTARGGEAPAASEEVSE